ncbi:MAG: YheU family protein [Steroidobacteraceae bacterium]
MEVPYAMLSPEALRGVLESVVLREGTDYGERERTLEQKVAELLERLRRREGRLVFDSRAQTVDVQPIDRNTKGK